MQKQHLSSITSTVDPSETEGYTEILQKEVLVHIRDAHFEKKFKQMEDWVMLRMFVTPEKQIKIELTSEVDIFFFQVMKSDWEALRSLMTKKGIEIGYEELPNWMRNVLEDKKQVYVLSFKSQGDEGGVLSINQKLPYKTVNILDLNFTRPAELVFKENLMYRYSRMRVKKDILGEVLSKSNHLIKLKNPSLLVNFQKTRKHDVFK